MTAIPSVTEAGSSGESSAGDEDPRPTRTEQTRLAASVNKLGVQIASLSIEDRSRLDLPERVREAIEVWQRLKPKSRGRQNRLIGQLLRAEDHEAIRERYENLDRLRGLSGQQEKVNERWLARLLDEGDAGVEALILEYPSLDRQRFRLLIRSTRQDPASRQGKRARRELLRAIRALRG